MRIFVCGISGTAMGSLAGLLKDLGHDVAGSDTAFYPPMGPLLQSLGIRLYEGFSAEHLKKEQPELVVVGNVCRRDNPEVVWAESAKIERVHVGEALQRFALPKTTSVVVTGTHGKTTTSSLLAHLLDGAGLRPGFFIGGVVESIGRGYRTAGARSLIQSGEPGRTEAAPFVLEGDEYDTAFWEKTPKFLHYGARFALLTSIEHDHVDIYPSFEEYEQSFRRFVSQLPEDGLLLVSAADPRAVEVAQLSPCPTYFYGVQGARHYATPHYYAEPALENENGISFDLFIGGVAAGRFLSPLPGRHNLENAVGAIGLASHGFRCSPRTLAQSLASFRGVKRRQELRGIAGGVSVYDDFAHHPTAVRRTLEALRGRQKGGRLISVFEPRSATACRKLHQADYPGAFEVADWALIADLGRSGLPESERLDVGQIVASLRARGVRADGPLSADAIVSLLAAETKAGDLVAVLSNGAFGGIHERLLDALSHGIHRRPSERN
jgi:UDP-N-acetylmuramate: L-alanyl-gamma-D-glutamyl-meso-diaminopimelate ligase